MLKTLRNAWKIKEIRTKLIFTFLMLVVIRFGSELPIPGVKTDFFANFFECIQFITHLPRSFPLPV